MKCSVLSMEKFEKAYGMRCNTSLGDGLKEYALLEAGKSLYKYRAGAGRAVHLRARPPFLLTQVLNRCQYYSVRLRYANRDINFISLYI